MPVMDSPEYAGKNQGELLKVAREKGVKVSVMSPRKTPEFIRAFEAAGGEMASAKVTLSALCALAFILISSSWAYSHCRKRTMRRTPGIWYC